MRSAASSGARERPFGTSLRALLLLAIAASFVVAAAPARATCPPTDPACVTETLTETVTEVTEPVTEVTDPGTGTIGSAVDEVKDTVGPVVDEVPPQLPGPTINVTESPTLGDPGVDHDPRTGRGALREDSGNGRSDLGTGTVAGRPVPVQALVGGTLVSGLDASQSADARTGPSPPAERTSVSLENVVKGFAFPLALMLVVGAFLLVQDRLDRRDPRLALAPVGPDVLDFT
jgi:hypothetical protein